MRWLSDRRSFSITILVGLVVVGALFMRGVILRPQYFEGSWVYGPTKARWTITEYADLECPFCKTYTPLLKTWVKEQKDVNLQWSHLPLEIHGPAARREARQVECAGKLGERMHSGRPLIKPSHAPTAMAKASKASSSSPASISRIWRPAPRRT